MSILLYLYVVAQLYECKKLRRINLAMSADSPKCLLIPFSADSSQQNKFYIPYLATLRLRHPSFEYSLKNKSNKQYKNRKDQKMSTREKKTHVADQGE